MHHSEQTTMHASIHPCRCAAFDAELADLLTTSILEDTLVILMSDHGIHDSDYTKTPAGGYEHRNPFLYLLMPKSHETAAIRETLGHNTNKLVTHQDFHQTQVALMTGTPGGIDGAINLTPSLLQRKNVA